MADQVLIRSQATQSHPIDPSGIGDGTGLWAYQGAPSTITMQIRSKVPAEGQISSIVLTAAEARKIGAYLLRKADELSPRAS